MAQAVRGKSWTAVIVNIQKSIRVMTFLTINTATKVPIYNKFYLAQYRAASQVQSSLNTKI